METRSMHAMREQILDYLRAARPRFAVQYGVRRIGVFGSLARGETAAPRDVDVLVDMDAPTFDRYMDLKFELEDHFGLPVDLVLEEALKPRLKPHIQGEVIYA